MTTPPPDPNTPDPWNPATGGQYQPPQQPYQAGNPGAPGGYASGYQQGYPGGQQGYPPAQQGYPGGQQGYPPAQQGYPGGQQGYPPAQPGYPVGQPGYPQSYPGGPTTLPAKPAVPPPVTGAFVIYVLSAALAVISAIYLLNSDIWTEALAGSGVTDSDISVAKTAGVAAVAVIAALYLLFALKMRAGRNWARITLTVVTGLSLLNSFARRDVTIGGHTYTPTAGWITWVGVILAVAAIVLMYVTPSNQYFAAVKGRRY